MHQDAHRYEDLIAIFNDCFAESYNTRLERGGDYPIYLPAFLDENNTPSERPYNVILFAQGFYSSGLHEIAHWLVAGEARRKLEDFGYWYEPDGRSAERQREFEQVEVKPQAIEWILATAANFRYFASSDNLTGDAGDNSAFKQAVYQQVKQYAEKGLPKRAEQLRQALARFYGTEDRIDLTRFDLSRI
ncbi:elongation factor P hydroxylase [Muribacter muris]|uniref:Elongation factor P hydroxylase n=1 Tax=Muribacter muris TaxID=67855 RepID=A0A4Y9K7A6_9PAST|nr:elongation factor P hydroxylase [Muribacter muris]MBF0783987.1 elongation factor P hydroxylase [Muribacter muris]MBF0827464.1 elongation factor P hydroxylase [Muribacter muris]TFV13382.1 elongation factor P hydroxylase [Muribacter muris]